MIPLVALAILQTGDPYAALASAIPLAEWNAVESYVEGKGPLPSFLPADSTLLSAQKAVAQRWGAVLEGLRKAADLPYAAGKTEPSQALLLGKLAGYAARPRFAEGDRHGAITFLLDGLTMASRTRSQEGEDAVLRSFAEHLNQIPLAECERIRTAIGSPSSSGLSLLRAHARIEAYRWQWLKLPTTLKDAMPVAETLDPAGRPFRYDPAAGGYRLQTERDKDGRVRTLAGFVLRESEGS